MNESLRAYLRKEATDKLYGHRHGDTVKVMVRGKVSAVQNNFIDYDVNWQFVKRQGNFLYVEERDEKRRAMFVDGKIQETWYLADENERDQLAFETELLMDQEQMEEGYRFYYDRQKAIQYAERWWNTQNPDYLFFKDDCTNFISQCLHAGGFSMTGYPAKNKGWWMRKGSWSFSWTVAHSLMHYLLNSKYVVQITDPTGLKLGDVIFYDFQGDGRFDHSTIVTGFDANNMPLVNAHTTNSRQRFWDYQDSTAYTPNIKYKFCQITAE